MSYRPCPVCGSAAVGSSIFGGYRYLQRRYDIVRCRTCGFFFTDPLPEQDILMDLYSRSEYFDEYVAPGSDSVGYLTSLDSPNEYDEMTLALLAQHRRDGRLLDVGCAGGRFLARAKEVGYEVFGIEPNARMAAYARDVLSLKVFEGGLHNAGDIFGPSFFDIVHLGDVLEHLCDLHGAFADIRSILREGGLLVLQQPMTYNRSLFNFFLGLNMLVKKDRYSPYPPLHLWEFVPGTMRRVLGEKGFQVLYFRTFESKPKTVSGTKDGSRAKARIGFYAKAVSCVVSNSPVFSFLGLGDRALVLCRKASSP